MNGDLRRKCRKLNGDLRVNWVYTNGDLRYTKFQEVILYGENCV